MPVRCLKSLFALLIKEGGIDGCEFPLRVTWSEEETLAQVEYSRRRGFGHLKPAKDLRSLADNPAQETDLPVCQELELVPSKAYKAYWRGLWQFRNFQMWYVDEWVKKQDQTQVGQMECLKQQAEATEILQAALKDWVESFVQDRCSDNCGSCNYCNLLESFPPIPNPSWNESQLESPPKLSEMEFVQPQIQPATQDDQAPPAVARPTYAAAMLASILDYRDKAQSAAASFQMVNDVFEDWMEIFNRSIDLQADFASYSASSFSAQQLDQASGRWFDQAKGTIIKHYEELNENEETKELVRSFLSMSNPLFII
jgi:hypothetical protein